MALFAQGDQSRRYLAAAYTFTVSRFSSYLFSARCLKFAFYVHGQTNACFLTTLIANAMLSALIIESGDEDEAYDRYMNTQSEISSNKSIKRCRA